MRILQDLLACVLKWTFSYLLDKKYREWTRYLSAGNYIFDRWEKARLMGFGEGTSIYDESLVIGDVKVGENTWIGPYTVLDGTAGIEIGDNCAISAGVHLYTHNSAGRIVSGGDEATTYAAVKIGNNAYIGPNAVVTMGVTIGDNATIGANSLVLKDVPAGCKAFGTPCKIQESPDIYS